MNNKNIIKTSHELNHFKGGYTRLELDFIYAFISTIKDEDEDFREYDLTLRDLEVKLQKRLQLRDIEYLFDSLSEKKFKINNDERLSIEVFFTGLTFWKKEKRITVRFNPVLKPHLLKLKTYAMGNFRYILQFRSEYTKRLYMLLAQWRSAGICKYTVDELREILDVPDTYKYSNFKQKVLKKAEKEMIDHADIFFEYEECKRGRSVYELVFHVKRNAPEQYEPAGELPIEAAGYKNKVIYFNGRDWRIVSISTTDDPSTNVVHIVLQDIDSGEMIAEQFNIQRLKLMVDQKENKQPSLF